MNDTLDVVCFDIVGILSIYLFIYFSEVLVLK